MTAPRAPANRAEVVEVMARTLYAQSCLEEPWDAADRLTKNAALMGACELLAALEAADVQLVPEEETEKMMRAAGCFGAYSQDFERELWRRRVAASPYAEEDGR